jgi:pimeloyl-ACP methyl ester carboxylesterase
MHARWTLLPIALPLAWLLAVAPANAADEKPAKGKYPFAVKVTGTGKPMIFIPGLACAGGVWDDTVDHFKDRYECHVLTLAGFAGQKPLADPSTFLDSVKKGVIRYVRDKKLDKPVLVGHSLGGHLVFLIGIAEPKLAGALIAVDGVPCFAAMQAPTIQPAAIKKMMEQRAKAAAKATQKQYLQEQGRIIAGMMKDKKNLEKVKKWAADSDRKTVQALYVELAGCDVRAQAAAIKSPVLLLGVHDKSSETVYRKLKEYRYAAQVAKVPDHKVAVADDAKHFIMYDKPKWMWKQMDDFLDKK